jgi:hypothetical protein
MLAFRNDRFSPSGTDGSNPLSSTGESAANLRRGSFGAVVTDPCLLCVLFRAGLRLRRQARRPPPSRAQAFEILEHLLDCDQQQVVAPQLGRVFLDEVGA